MFGMNDETLKNGLRSEIALDSKLANGSSPA
jgi:hypothetical protein